jgi:hypothetical protein
MLFYSCVGCDFQYADRFWLMEGQSSGSELGQSSGIFSADTLHKHNLIFSTDLYYYQMSFRQKTFEITPYSVISLWFWSGKM